MTVQGAHLHILIVDGIALVEATSKMDADLACIIKTEEAPSTLRCRR